MYSPTSYTPPVKVDSISDILHETSGLQMAGNFLWSFNDGGNAAAIYRLDTASSAILQTVNLGGATNVDWEEISFDGTFFYVGDFGNNADGARTDLKIYKFPFSAIPDYTTNPVATIASGQIEVISFTYSDQITVTPAPPNSTAFDCEAMIIDAGKIHLFSKNWLDSTTTHYIINGTTAGTYVANKSETLPAGYLVTAASKAPGSAIIALLGYRNSGFGNHFMTMLSDFSGGQYFNGNVRLIDLPNAVTMGQAEGITFRTGTYGYISNEKFTRGTAPFILTVLQKLRSFSTDGFVPPYVLPVNLKSFGVSNKNGVHQINWSFTEAGKNVKVLYSANGAAYTTLAAYPSSVSGSFFNLPVSGSSCYRLTWEKSTGAVELSNIICSKEEVKDGLRNIVLHKNGQLTFTLTGTGADDYLFRLLTTDGKLIMQSAKRMITAGTASIKLSNNLPHNGLVLLQAIGSKEQKNLLVKVQE